LKAQQTPLPHPGRKSFFSSQHKRQIANPSCGILRKKRGRRESHRRLHRPLYRSPYRFHLHDEAGHWDNLIAKSTAFTIQAVFFYFLAKNLQGSAQNHLLEEIQS
jgi:hypothetical protein